MEIIFATNNQGKIREVKELIGNRFSIITLKEAGITEEIPEPFNTFKGNVFAKANYVYKKTGKPCWAEDSGLVVPALNGAPGVFSARYAGMEHNDDKNNEKLLKELSGHSDRSAFYHATICLILHNIPNYFEGQCHGSIIEEYHGNGGFGYDPLFVPNGYEQTFGELSAVLKNKISHRAEAMSKLVDFLNKMDY